MVRENPVKQKLKNGEAVIGTFVKTTDPSVIEILGCTGMEFFVIDSEHVAYNPETVTDLVRASDLTGIVPIVRVREATAVNIMQALDAGALGYHAPQCGYAGAGQDRGGRGTVYAPGQQRLCAHPPRRQLRHDG